MTPAHIRRSMRRYQLAGVAGIALVAGTVGAWAALADIAGAVIAPGTMVVESHSKRIQHREGGIVAEIAVRDGSLVKAGDRLLRLDDTEAKAELGIVEGIRTEWLAKAARLRAERDGSDRVAFPDELETRRGEPAVAEIVTGQEKLFNAQRAANEGRKQQLGERIGQLADEIRGLEAQVVSKREQSELIARELTGVRSLLKQGLVQVTRVLALEREAARLAGEQGQLDAEIARARGQIGEVKLQIIQIDDDARTKTLDALREAEAKLVEFTERQLAIRARLARTVIVAPRSGYVHDLAVHTIGGVIGAGETVMQIVPEEDALVVEARVRPQDIDRVSHGQAALMRFPNADSRVTPEVVGRVVHISADLKQTAPDLPPFYSVRLALDPDERAKLGGLELKPGMPAEAFMQTGLRSPLSYLLQPFENQFAHAFRER